MSSIGSPAPFFFGGAKSYEIERSLRFISGDSTKLTRTFGTNTSNTTKTVSFWVKRGNVSSSSHQNIFSTTISGMIEGRLFFLTDDRLQFEERDASGGTSDGRRITRRKFRDASAWYHIVLVLNSTEGTEIDRAKIYVNGTQVTTFDQTRDIDQDYSFSFFRSSVDNFIGVMNASSEYFDGYLAEINFIDGQALTPASFGETNAITGQWLPKKYTGTYGNNGFYLKFNDNTNNAALGADSSGNGNNWTPTNISSSHDTLSDTPTNNFCTLNPLNKTNDADLREGNLKFFQSSNDESATATFAITSGKWYWEVYKNSSQNPELGIDTLNLVLSNKSDNVSSTKVNFRTNGGDQQVGTGSPTSITGSSGGQTGAGVIAIAVDFDNKKIWYSDLSGNFFNSGNPATGSNAAFTFSNVAVANGCVPHFFCGTGSNNSFNVNFGQEGTFGGNTTAGGYADGNGHGNFKYSVPSGYLALCSKNLPDPTIKKGNKYFDTAFYTGDGSSGQQITGLNFQPDFIWIKCRSDNKFHILVDLVRGNSNNLTSNSSSTEYTETHITSFNSDGFTVADIDSGTANENGFTYVGWSWNAGGSTSNNSDGSITSQVRANTTAGFSIVGYTGTGSNATVGHGLGVKPDCVLAKRRSGDTNDWFLFHKDIGNTKNLRLNLSNSVYTTANIWNNTDPTSSVVNIGSSSAINSNGSAFIMYCFNEVAGYSKFGKYTGNGNANGTFVFLGFEPAFVMVKSVDASEHWNIPVDVHFNNGVDKTLSPNLSNDERDMSGGDAMDFLSNGFKIRNNDNNYSNNGVTFIYLAFAKAPFKYTRAR